MEYFAILKTACGCERKTIINSNTVSDYYRVPICGRSGVTLEYPLHPVGVSYLYRVFKIKEWDGANATAIYEEEVDGRLLQ